MGYGRNYGYREHGRGGYPSGRDNRGRRPYQDNHEYQTAKEIFDSGNFSEIRKNIRNYQGAIKRIYSESKEKAKNFPKWDERDIIRNAAIISAHAVLTDLRTTQIRKIIEMAKRLHTEISTRPDEEGLSDKIKKEALRMNMLTAYYAGKNKSVLPLQEVLEPVLNWLSNNPTPENFEKVYTFFEAIVAYHRYFGGKD